MNPAYVPEPAVAGSQHVRTATGEHCSRHTPGYAVFPAPNQDSGVPLEGSREDSALDYETADDVRNDHTHVQAPGVDHDIDRAEHAGAPPGSSSAVELVHAQPVADDGYEQVDDVRLGHSTAASDTRTAESMVDSTSAPEVLARPRVGSIYTGFEVSVALSVSEESQPRMSAIARDGGQGGGREVEIARSKMGIDVGTFSFFVDQLDFSYHFI